jgi:phosphatidate cytidylyltransferase
MSTRIIAALIALPLVIIPIYLGGVWCTLLFLVVSLAAGLEFYNLMDVGGFHPIRSVGLVWLAAILLGGWRPDLFPLPAVLVAGLIITLTATLPHEKNPAGAWMSTSMGAIYLGVAAGQTLALRQLPDGLWWIVFGLVVAWANDSVAYFTGVTVGRHKLWPRLSPKKTWEGTIGGWAAAALAGAITVWLSPLDESVYLAALIGAACGLLGLLGDLSISMLKRQVGAKDSGHFLPGHGGILDRLDSLLYVLPFIATVVLLRAAWA